MTGVVVGSRKAGTTWLYRNFLADPDTSVSPVVKESRFFLGAMSEQQYHSLFTEPGQRMLEVDTALCYDDRTPLNITAYAAHMNVLLVLREPVSYAVSRYIHALRKGELYTTDIYCAIRDHPIFHTELDYARMVDRFAADNLRLKVMFFETLGEDPVRFYREAKRHLTDLDAECSPAIMDRMNLARTSRWPALSKWLSDAAKGARSHQLHGLVNLAKLTGINRILERPSSDEQQADLHDRARIAVEEFHGDAMRVYRAMR